MARIRTLKPEILEDAKTAGLSDAAFRLFVSAICLADDYGDLQGDERWLRSQIWWAHGDSPRIAEILRELRRASLVTIYECRGQKYLHLRGWSKHQRIDNRGKPRVPKHDDADVLVIVDDEEDPQPVRGNPPRNSAKRGDSPPDLRPPTSDPEGDGEGECEGRVAGKPRKPKPDRTDRKVKLPATWEPNQKAADKARESGLDLAAQVEKFRDHHTANGSKFADWDAAFRKWLGNAYDWSKPTARGLFDKQPAIGRAQPLQSHEYTVGEREI